MEMNKDKYPHQSFIKRDIEEIVGRVVGEIVGTALQLISDQLSAKADKADITRLENKLDATIDNTDEHSKDIRALKARFA
jgi:hypothetical protein